MRISCCPYPEQGNILFRWSLRTGSGLRCCPGGDRIAEFKGMIEGYAESIMGFEVFSKSKHSCLVTSEVSGGSSVPYYPGKYKKRTLIAP